jgi:hypothetical protein
MIQPAASYIVIRWLGSETIAMIGSPAVRVAIQSIDRSATSPTDCPDRIEYAGH